MTGERRRNWHSRKGNKRTHPRRYYTNPLEERYANYEETGRRGWHSSYSPEREQLQYDAYMQQRHRPWGTQYQSRYTHRERDYASETLHPAEQKEEIPCAQSSHPEEAVEEAIEEYVSLEEIQDLSITYTDSSAYADSQKEKEATEAPHRDTHKSQKRRKIEEDTIEIYEREQNAQKATENKTVITEQYTHQDVPEEGEGGKGREEIVKVEVKGEGREEIVEEGEEIFTQPTPTEEAEGGEGADFASAVREQFSQSAPTEEVKEFTEAGQETAAVRELVPVEELVTRQEPVKVEDLVPVEEFSEVRQELVSKPQELVPVEELITVKELVTRQEPLIVKELVPVEELVTVRVLVSQPQELVPVKELVTVKDLVSQSQELVPVKELAKVKQEEQAINQQELVPVEELVSQSQEEPVTQQIINMEIINQQAEEDLASQEITSHELIMPDSDSCLINEQTDRIAYELIHAHSGINLVPESTVDTDIVPLNIPVFKNISTETEIYTPSDTINTVAYDYRADTSEDISRPESIPSIYTYLMAKYKVEQEEVARLQEEKNKEQKVSPSVEAEITMWSNNKEMRFLGYDKELISEAIRTADERSKLNEAPIPDREPHELASYVYTDTIKNIEAKHKISAQVYVYAGDEAAIKSAFLEIGKNFLEIRRKYLPWRSHKEIVKLYYLLKYKLRLKPSQIATDTRKIPDKELNEIVARDWAPHEMEIFSSLFPELGKKWKEYMKSIPGKTEIDLKIFYKYFKKYHQKKEKAPVKIKQREEKKEETLDDWKIHERQTFALLFPHIGKNWGVLANYIVTKTAAEIRAYHRIYYKNLRAGERILEIYLKDIGTKEVRTDPLPIHEFAGHQQKHSRYAGVLFSCK
ncbi:uncharacterized protein NESG_00514 [Nematocida ausubeli]|uniref:SANT domain-containing protein n=1 Tax=Nematocida ausubeli (strain ATCC PRA-371 / ERTm2) TaxID=1913371 RepID=A0A086J5L7_NEMA1|nr:uncharacterized protein NESG_00514 [Nematocida ausubeli]KFG27435.1 hypothetical protein NESG_00514 [Nematocida ausubeli]